jgi:UDP-3-O-[3-hydroxymyristoyl] glucosamine N-acyltransferase
MKRSYLLAELAQLLGAELRGNAEQEISALATLQSAGSADLSFIANPAYKKYLSTTQAPH